MTSRSREDQDPAAGIAPPKLSREEVDRILVLRLIAKLGTIDPDGGIHLVPMWFRREGNEILIPTSQYTRKYKNAKARPRASVMVDLSRAGLDLRGVLVRGPVRFAIGDEAHRLNRTIHERYVTEEGLADPDVVAYLGRGDDITLKVEIEKVVTWNNAGSPAGRALLASGAVHPLDGSDR